MDEREKRGGKEKDLRGGDLGVGLWKQLLWLRTKHRSPSNLVADNVFRLLPVLR